MNVRKLIRAISLPVLALLISLQVFAQAKTVTGRVTGANGLPASGVTITIKGTATATSTDEDGRFSLSVPEGATLVFSSVGFDRREVSIGNQTQLNVSLQTATANLGEVVVVGYGTQRRKDVTGAISRVTSEKLTALPTPSFEAALQGRAAGVQVTQGSGLAGSGSVIRIRGISSVSAGGDPLYVIDGIPINADPFIRGNSGAMNQNPLAAINPNDIESIEILKDAGAAGIYGSRGANGVILITTKKGKAGKPRFNFTTKAGVTTYAMKPDFVNAQEWLALRQEAWENDGNTGRAPLPNGITWEDGQKTNTDWWDQVTRTGVINDNNLSVTFGKGILRSYIAGNYANDQSYLKGNSLQRMGVRTNFELKFSDKFNMGVNAAFNRSVNNRVEAAWAGGLGAAMSTALPIYPVRNADGTYFTNGNNPVINLDNVEWQQVDNRTIGGIFAEYRPIKNLTLRVQGGGDYLDNYDRRFSPDVTRPDRRGNSYIAPFWNWNYNYTGTATYNLNLNEKNKFVFLAGYEYQKSKGEYASGLSLPLTDKPLWETRDKYDSLKGAPTYNTSLSRGSTWNFESYFGRINYNFNDKFLLQALVRVDGSSRFGTNNKYGFFPAASAAYVLSEEDFIRDLDFINFLKLRVSYGLTGNANIEGSRYRTNYYVGGTYGGNPTQGPENIGNPDLKWENTANGDLGLEFGLFNNRVSGEVSYYRKVTTDLLGTAGVAPSTGFENVLRNINGSEILNEGVELSLNTKNIVTRDFTWSTNFNIARNYNELVSLGGLSPDAFGGGTNDTRSAEGYPIGTNYLVRYYGVDPTDGMPIWLDNNNKMTKTFSLNYRVPAGKVVPDFVGGITNTFTYKNWELNSLFTFVQGVNIYDASAKRQLGVVTDWNIRRDIADRWRKPGDVARFPRLTMNSGNYAGLSSEWQYNSTMFLYDGSFLRLRELTVGYRLPASLLNKVKLQSARLYFTGMNLLTFTKFPGGDPEIARDFENVQDRNMSPNITYLTPPQQKAVIFGLNINF